MLIVAVLPSILFPPKKPVGRSAGPAAGDTGAATAPPTARAAPESLTARPSVRPSAATPADTVWVTSPLYRLGFTTRGGALVRAELLGYRSFAKADSGRPVQLVREGVPLLVYRRTGGGGGGGAGGGGDTTLVSDWRLTPSATQVQVGSEGGCLTFTGASDGARLALESRLCPAGAPF